VSDDQQTTDEVNVQGVSRMLAWANVVVPVMTPEMIPYRGIDGFLNEAEQTFKVAALSGLTADDLYDSGLHTAQARAYGFTVNSETSVEFGLAADAWSRGGVPVTLLFSVIATLGLMMGEWFARRGHWYGTAVASVLALPVAKAAFFDSTSVHLLPMLRGMVLYILITALFVALVELTRLTTAGSRQHGIGLRSRLT
jgi:hypothetical protein